MKIAILNECFFDKQHIEWLKKFGDVVICKDTDSEEKTIERLQDVDIAIGDQFIAKFSKKVLESAQKLKLLALNTISFAYVDLKTASERGITVSNVPGFSKQAVAEFAIGLMFAVNRKIAFGDRLMRKTPFELDPGNKDHQKFIGFDMKGKTLGVVGLGNIGSVVAQLGMSFGMKVVAFNRGPKKINGVRMLALAELLKVSDVVSVHIALNTDTKGIISNKEFELMKPNAILINTSQPEIVNTESLYDALKSDRISGAAIDIGTMIKPDHPLFKLENVVLTPHAGSFTNESFFVNLPKMIVENVESFVKGKPINVVS